MISLAFFLFSALADEYWKTICLCPSSLCYGSYKCDGQPTLDPTSSTFINDLNYVRKNIKNINIYFDSLSSFAISLDLRAIAGLTMNFTSYSNVNVTFNYVNGEDYGGNNFHFLDSYVVPIFIPIADSKSNNVLRIGTINSTKNDAVFYPNGDRKTILNYDSLMVSVASLANISGLNKVRVGELQLLLGKNDEVTIRFTKTTVSMKLKDAEFSFKYAHEDKFGIIGQFYYSYQYNDTLKIIIEDGVAYSDLPAFSFNELSTVEFIGKLWAPSSPSQIGIIKKVSTLIIPPGDFPYTVYTDQVMFKVSGDTTIHGNIDASSYSYSSSKMAITTDLKKRVNVTFKGYVDSTISPRSPYLNINIDNMTHNATYSTIYLIPIGVSFNEDECSYVYVKSIEFYNGRKTSSADEMETFPTITQALSDSVLDSKKIKSGFVFLDLPADTLESTKFIVKVSSDSPSVKEGIPGFVAAGNCMTVAVAENTGRLKLKTYKSKTAYSLPTFLCITDGDQCSNPSGFASAPFTKITALIDGDISPFVKEGFNEIYIGTTIYGKEIKINFNNLRGSNYNVTLVGRSSSSSYESIFSIIAASGKIQNLTMKFCKLSKGFSFNMPVINLVQVAFVPTETYTFSATSKLTTDALSLESIFKLNNPPTMNEVFLKQDYTKINGYYVYDYDEDITIDNDMYKICITAWDDYYYDYNKKLKEVHNETLRGIDYDCGSYWDSCTRLCVGGIDTKYFNKFSYLSEHGGSFTINSMTTKIKPINMIVDPKASYYSYYWTLKGNGWTTKLTDKFVVNNGDHFMKIKVSSPGQADNIKITGTASVLFEVDYPSAVNYCVYVDGAKPTCKSSYTDKNQVVNDKFSEYVDNINQSSVTISFDRSSNIVEIPMSLFNMRKVTIKTTYLYSNKEMNQVTLGFDNTKLDPIYSLTIFDDIRTVYTKDTPATAYFGQFQVTGNWTVDEKWKQYVSLEASQMICKYQHLEQFKSIRINDQLNLTGNLLTEGEEVVIDFSPDGDANDLVADIGGNITIYVDNGFIKIGKYKFMISHSDKYDAYFMVKEDSNITVNCAVTNKNNFPKFVIDCLSNDATITFVGNYPTLSSGEESLIMLRGSQKVNIIANSNIPVSVYSFINIEFNFMEPESTDLKITGPIEYTSTYLKALYGRIKFYNHQTKRIKITIPNGININKMESDGSNLTSIMTPNIDLEIEKITRTSESVKGTIYITNSIGKAGSSFVWFEEPLPEGIVFSNSTNVITQVYGKITDESIFPFVSSQEAVIKAKAEDLAYLTFKFNYIVINKEVNKEGLTHGFYPGVNCLTINQTRVRDYSEVRLSAFVKPSEIPFIIDFVNEGEKTDGELIITDSNIKDLDNLNNLLPNVFVGIVMRLRRDMTENAPLNLNSIVGGRSSLSVEIQSIGNSQFNAHVTLPTSKILSISCLNVRIGFIVPSGSSNFLAKKVNFTDCTFLNSNQFKFSNEISEVDTDVDSFNSLVTGGVFNSFPGKVVVSSANVILFTKDGWKFREDRSKPTVPVAPSSFKNIQFQTGLFCLLMIEDETLDSIHAFKFDSFPDDQGTVLFELSRHWGKIKNLNGFKINVNGATRVNLNTASYPIPKLFDIDESNIGYTLETDASGNFDTITLENNRLFKDEDLNINFQFLPPEYQYVNGDKVFFEGNSNINLVNDVGALRVNESVFSSHSNTTLSKLETLKLMTVDRTAEVTGTFKFSLSSTLQLHWTLTETPMINHKSFEKGSPQWLELIYDDSKVDKNLYREKLLRKNGIVLMKGNFECFSVKNNIKFGGSYAPFGAGNTHLSLGCDSSAEGQVLLLQGLTDISDDEDDASQGGGSGKGPKVTSGGVVGIVIAIAIIVGIVAAGVVYFIQRKKIDRLKNEIPAENTDAYKTASYETRETTQSSSDYNVAGTEDPFDDV